MERIQVKLQFSSTWRFRHGHWADTELFFDPKRFKAIFKFEGQEIPGIEPWGSPRSNVYRWGIRTRFALFHPFTWNDPKRWSLEFVPLEQPVSPSFHSTGGSMAKVEATPEELEIFAKTLKQFAQQLQGGMKQLKGAQQRLGETWRDQENTKYAQEFGQAMRVLERFIVASEQQAPYLQRKAQSLRNYLQQR
jgi:uncharacterized protein YukE